MDDSMYNAADDISAFWTEQMDGTLAEEQPDDVYELINRIADHPREALHAMRIPADPDVSGMSDVIRARFGSAYLDAASAYDGGAFESWAQSLQEEGARTRDDIAARCRVDRAEVDGVVYDALLGNPARLDALLADYYR